MDLIRVCVLFVDETPDLTSIVPEPLWSLPNSTYITSYDWLGTPVQLDGDALQRMTGQ